MKAKNKNIFKTNYVVIPALVITVAAIGSAITDAAMHWYQTQIVLPTWTPTGALIGAVWTTLFMLATISLLLVFNKTKHDTRWGEIMSLFIVNGLLNIGWTVIFFGYHRTGLAVWCAAILGFSVYMLMWHIYSRHKCAALLLAPYALWVTFATYLTYSIYIIN